MSVNCGSLQMDGALQWYPLYSADSDSNEIAQMLHLHNTQQQQQQQQAVNNRQQQQQQDLGQQTAGERYAINFILLEPKLLQCLRRLDYQSQSIITASITRVYDYSCVINVVFASRHMLQCNSLRL
jgi:hypothetical protein